MTAFCQSSPSRMSHLQPSKSSSFIFYRGINENKDNQKRNNKDQLDGHCPTSTLKISTLHIIFFPFPNHYNDNYDNDDDDGA